jgi:hypothetical protein
MQQSLLLEKPKNLWIRADEITGFSYYLVIPEHSPRSKNTTAFKPWIVDELM